MISQFYNGNLVEAGCDEAGRGCLAGPVVAAAVIFPHGFDIPGIDDSKKLSPSRREVLRREIEKHALAWAVGQADNIEIDKINILNASILAMHRALSRLTLIPEHIIVDGNQFKCYGKIPHTCIVRGDSLFLSISAASILAKTHRDEIMTRLHEKYPVYGWHCNKGYATRFHTCAMESYGTSPLHRKTFRLKSRQLKMEF
jgi:ribonuclease HII